MKQGKELWYDALNLVCHKYLVAIQLYLIALHVDTVLDTWEVENTSQVEWEIYIQVDPEQRLVRHRVEGTIEILVVLVFQCTWSLSP